MTDHQQEPIPLMDPLRRVKDALLAEILAAGVAGEWGSISGTLADQLDLQTALDAKLSTSSYSAADVLAKLLTVDGTGTNLDADKLDGQEGAQYLSRASHTGTQAIATITTLQATLDAKLAISSYTAADVLSKILTVDGAGSGLDADLLDGDSSTFYVARANHTGTQTASTISDFSTAADARITAALGVSAQAFDADLSAIAALSGTNTIYYRSAANTWSAVTIGGLLSFSAGTLNITNAALVAVGALTPAADRLPYFTSGTVAALATFTAAGRALIDDADATAQRATLGLVIGTNVQAYDTDLDAVAASGVAGAWTAYTPTIAAGAGSFTSVTATGKYMKIGKTVLVRIRVTITTNGTASTYWTATMPFASVNAGSALEQQLIVGREVAVTGHGVTGSIQDNSTTCIVAKSADNSYAGGNGHTYCLTGSYEVA